jgi:mannosyl-glycoprotein endo-beta-N-acetylglucosaminidase
MLHAAVGAAALLLKGQFASAAGQPYVPFFFPGAPISNSVATASSILTWNPATDPNVPFNVATVPLASRFTPSQVNSNVPGTVEGTVTSLASFGGTSNDPAQGAFGSGSMLYYTPTYWQYTSQLVDFGGSAGEGSLVLPPAPLTDAAHRNGIPVLGTVFLGPTTYGGWFGQVSDFLQQSGSDFPVADKLIQAAKTYGFDGWFINQETAGGNSATATQMQAFIEYVHQQDPGLTIEWYDAMTTSGSISYQNKLDSSDNPFFQQSGTTGVANRVADSVYLNYGWSTSSLTSSASLANSDGRSPYSLYAGIDVGSNNAYNATNPYLGGNNQPLSEVFPSSTSQTMSLGLFAAQQTLSAAQSNSSSGSDLAKLQNFYGLESLFWTGSRGSASNTATAIAGTNWYGIANYIPVQSTITSAPFVTNFATGQGQMYAINGQTMASGEWNNLALQDVQPSWRWLVITTGTALVPSLDFTKAYYGGVSLNISGSTSAANNVNLYATEIPVTASTNFSLAYTDGASNSATQLSVSLSLNTSTGSLVTDVVPVQNTASAGWNTQTFSLGAYAGDTLLGIGLLIDGTNSNLSNYSINIGQLRVYNGVISTPAPVTNLVQTGGAVTNSSTGTVRLQWTGSASSAYAYNVYQQLSTGSLTFLGAMPANAYYAQGIVQQGNSNFVTLQVETVGQDFGLSPHVTTQAYIDWARSAETLTWQGNGANPGGSGTWDTASTNWNAGASAPANQFWSNAWADTAVFNATGGAVAVSTPVTVGGLVFNASGYSLAGANPITLAGTMPMIAVNGAGYNATIATPLLGTAGLLKTGPGTVTLSNAGYYTGGTNISAGTVAVTNPNALGSGTVTLSGGRLALAVPPAVQLITGFNNTSSGSVFTLHQGGGGNGPTLTAGNVTLTDGNTSEANSIFTTSPVTVTNAAGFTASFNYEPSPVASGLQADGLVFMLQNDPRKTLAIGDEGGSLGYTQSGNDTDEIKNSLAVYFNIYSTTATGMGTGGVLGSSISTSPVNFALGDVYQVTVVYSGSAQTLTETIVDTQNSATFNHTYSGVNLATAIGGTSAYAGFTGATGGLSSTQTVSNFSFSNNINAPAGITNTVSTLSGTSSSLSVAVATNGIGTSAGTVSVAANSRLELLSGTIGQTAVLVLPQLVIAGSTNNWAGTVDLTSNALDITAGNLATIQNQLASGYTNNWQGTGITSSSAAGDTSHLTALGSMENTLNGSTPLYGAGDALGLFEGISPGATDILIKYTYYGDTNLNGVVDGSDYSRVDTGYSYNQAHPNYYTGWFNGDFNYDGVIDGSDYTLMDNAFNLQSGQITAETAAITAQVAATTAVPEPTAMCLLGMGASAMLGRRRR